MILTEESFLFDKSLMTLWLDDKVKSRLLALHFSNENWLFFNVYINNQRNFIIRYKELPIPEFIWEYFFFNGHFIEFGDVSSLNENRSDCIVAFSKIASILMDCNIFCLNVKSSHFSLRIDDIKLRNCSDSNHQMIGLDLKDGPFELVRFEVVNNFSNRFLIISSLYSVELILFRYQIELVIDDINLKRHV